MAQANGELPAPSRTRMILAGIVVALVVIIVWALIEYRQQPPPPPHAIGERLHSG